MVEETTDFEIPNIGWNAWVPGLNDIDRIKIQNKDTPVPQPLNLNGEWAGADPAVRPPTLSYRIYRWQNYQSFFP